MLLRARPPGLVKHLGDILGLDICGQTQRWQGAYFQTLLIVLHRIDMSRCEFKSDDVARASHGRRYH